ncbi:hypothetical protein AN963_21520 [Brevibacillus choshinensis]|uniref:Uncharacterized protein n=1 Tax=Brevibacillus choshinensis TaxID=54911 RepID=A0ABR5N4L8_BRECH|nr:hypothetical protein [Brevibacillus choshinensis]KQL45223.1 hypothetical protein AN963_21520 [Brevibacillus choshinensis]
MKEVTVLESEHKQYTEKVLNHIFVGSQLDGVKFGLGPGAFLIRFEHYTNHSPDQLWLNIESRWAVFPKETRVFPKSEAEMIDFSEEEAYQSVFLLRREKVTSVRLGSLYPHLHIGFESGKTLFVNGYHDKYECWQAGDGPGYTGQEWLIVATPGGDISTWAPDSFN